MAESIAELTALYAQFCVAWVIADGILTTFGMFLVVLTLSPNSIAGVLTNAVLSAFPPPFNFIVMMEIDTVGVIIQFFLYIFIIALMRLNN